MKQQEQGRSMVEMLGVLAIIGVLSIGGIAGYTMAMNRYRANEILDTASKLSVSAQTAAATAKNASAWNDAMDKVYDEMDLWNGKYETTFDVNMSGDVWIGGHSSGVDNALKSMVGDSYHIIKSQK